MEEPIRILDKKENKLRNRIILYVKILWRHHKKAEATWELEWEIRDKYPALFNPGN